MTGAERVQRRLTYIGKRIAASGRLVGFWVDDEGNEYGYRKSLGPAAPGTRYDVTVAPEGGIFLAGEEAPRYVDRLPLDDSRVLEWTARDRAAQVAHALQARARREAATDALELACRPLQELYAAERTAVGRSALLAALIQQISRPLSRSTAAGAH
ncbi:MAG: hypothetical protein ABR540_18850 [Acidimicrobiales bacterium]